MPNGSDKQAGDHGGNGTVAPPAAATELRTPAFWCAMCEKSFPSSTKLREHGNTAHNMTLEVKP